MFLLLSMLSSVAVAVTLDDAWKSAESSSPLVGLLHEQQVQTGAMKTQAWALVQPKLVLQGSWTRNEYETAVDFTEGLPASFQEIIGEVDPIVVNKLEYFSGNVTVLQPIFSGIALPLLKGAIATVKAGADDERAAKADLRVGIATAYYGLHVAREATGIAGRAVESARRHAQLAATTVTVGATSELMRMQADTALARAERQLGQSAVRVAEAEQALARLTGLPPETAVDPPDPPSLPYTDRDAALRRAESVRPDLSAAAYRQRAANMQLVASHLSWLPEVDGRFTYNYTGNTGFSNDPTMWMVVLSANWTLWDGGMRVANETIAASQHRSAALAGRALRDEVREEITTLWERHTRASESVRGLGAEIGLAERTLKVAEVAFGAGAISYLDVEDARMVLDAARLISLTEGMERDLAAYRLLAATGDL